MSIPNPGKGSKFKIYLPQTQEYALAPAPKEDSAMRSTGTGTILLVEDEEALLNLTADRLTECGYTVLPARDGMHALEIERSFHGSIDLLLTDVMMPRMGGLALARSLSNSRPGIRVMFMTGHAEHEASFREALRSGAESIQKPFSHEKLISYGAAGDSRRSRCKFKIDLLSAASPMTRTTANLTDYCFSIAKSML